MNIVVNILVWFFIGANLLNILVLIVFRTGAVYSNRNADGTLKKKMPFRGLLIMILAFFFITSFFITFDFFAFNNLELVNFYTVLIFNFVLLIILDFYDAFVIDILVLSVWRPKFLKIDKNLNFESMKKHLKSQFTVGWLFKIPILFISSFLYIFFREI